jgi:hypothetical protein
MGETFEDKDRLCGRMRVSTRWLPENAGLACSSERPAGPERRRRVWQGARRAALRGGGESRSRRASLPGDGQEQDSHTSSGAAREERGESVRPVSPNRRPSYFDGVTGAGGLA